MCEVLAVNGNRVIIAAMFSASGKPGPCYIMMFGHLVGSIFDPKGSNCFLCVLGSQILLIGSSQFLDAH